MRITSSLPLVQIQAQKQLLDHYDPNACTFFSSPKSSLLAKAPFADLLDVGLQSITQKVKESLRFAKELGHSKPVVVGAIGFDSKESYCLKLSTRYEVESISKAISAPDKPAPNIRHKHKYQLEQIPDPIQFTASIKEALNRFSNSALEKVVLSRTLQIQLEDEIDIKTIVQSLKERNPDAYTFAVKLDDTTAETILVGASPELLISRKGNRITANPLAGTEPRSSNPERDQELANQLLHSEKDLREHALVIKSVAKALKPYCKSLHIPDSPSLINTPTLWHLSTLIEGELKDDATTSLELALAMHPTPAVCGYPTDLARKTIRDLEGYDRGMFTGMVGWCDAAGDGEWVVTIRCAEISKRKICLYAGAGVVAGSSPEKELVETGSKFNTMLDALNIKERVSV